MWIGVTLAAALAIAPKAKEPPPWELAYYRSQLVSIRQCHYADGSKAILLTTTNPGRMAFILRETEPGDTLVPLEMLRNGSFRFEANGGLGTYDSIRLAVEQLRRRAAAPVNDATLDHAMASKDTAPCDRKEFFYDLAEDKMLVGGKWVLRKPPAAGASKAPRNPNK